MNMNQKGQTIPLVILLAVLGLVWGLAMTGSQVSRVEETGETEDYNRAFSAAEAGLEEVALQIKDDPSKLTQTFSGSGSLSETQAGYQYDCSPAAGQNFVELSPIAKDDVGQVNLADEAAGAYTTGDINIYWVKRGTSEETSPASLVISLITRGVSGEGCVDNYCIEKFAVNPAATPRSNGFATASASTNPNYTSKYTVSIPGGEQAQLLRIRAMYNTGVPASVRAEVASPSQFGFQYQECTATGTAGDNQAKQKFTISFPSLPAIFDYVLFSGSTTTPLTHQ